MKHSLLLLVSLILLAVSFWRIHIVIDPIRVPYSQIDDVAQLSATLEKTGLTTDTTPILQNDSLIASISGFRVIFAKDKDLATQVRALQLILPSLKIGDTNKSEIDLRFTKLIVR